MKKLLSLILLLTSMLTKAGEFDEFDEFNSEENKKQASPWTLAGFVEFEESGPYMSYQRARLQTSRPYSKGAVYGKFDFVHDDITNHNKIDVREARIQYRLTSKIDLSLGRQVSTWGVADMLFINDLFPKNWNALFLGRDMDMLKDPSNSLRLTGYFGKWTVDLVYQPEFTEDVTPTGCRFDVFDPNSNSIVRNANACNGYVPLKKDGTENKDPETAISIKTKIKDHELAFYGYDGFYKSPRGLLAGSPLVGYHPELVVLGLSDEGQWGPGIFSFEYGHYNSKEDPNGDNFLIENSKNKFLFGYRFDVSAKLALGFQYYTEQILDYDKYESSFLAANPAGYQYRKEEWHNTYTMRLTYKAQQETLWISLFTYVRPQDKDTLSKLEVSKKFTDNFKLTTGVNVFSGDDNYRDREFGMLKDDDNFFVRANYSF